MDETNRPLINQASSVDPRLYNYLVGRAEECLSPERATAIALLAQAEATRLSGALRYHADG